MRYKGSKFILKTLRFRLKTNTALTIYFNFMYSESHIWLNAGIQAHRAGLSVFDTNKIATMCQSIPQAWVHGAIKAGMEMKGCTHVKYGRKVYPLYSATPLGKKSQRVILCIF